MVTNSLQSMLCC